MTLQLNNVSLHSCYGQKQVPVSVNKKANLHSDENSDTKNAQELMNYNMPLITWYRRAENR